MATSFAQRKRIDDLIEKTEAIKSEAFFHGDWAGVEMAAKTIVAYEQMLGLNPEGRLI